MEGRPVVEAGQRPVYIYNGVTDLRELKDISLKGASLFFNGTFSVDGLRHVNLQGAHVFFNGKLQSGVTRGVSQDAVATTVSSPLPKSDGQVEASSHDGSRNSSPHVDPAVRRPSKALDSGKMEYSSERTDSKPTSAGIDHLNPKDAEICPFHNEHPACEHIESVTTSGNSLPDNANLTPFGLNGKVTGRQQTRTSGRAVDRSMLSARSVRFNVPAVLPTPVPSLPLKHVQCTNPGPRRRDSMSETVHKSTSHTSPSNRSWEHERADVHLKLPPQKRPSDQDIWISSKVEKKPRLEKHNGFDLDKQINKLVQEEVVQRSKRAKQLSDNNNNGHDATAEHEKTRKLSTQRNEMRSQLLGKPPRPLSASTIPSGPTKDRLAVNVPQLMPRLPQSSPLNNVINSATLNEEIVQTRIWFNIAQKDLFKEKARRGTASKALSARVTALNKKLAVLHRKRTEINDDTDRMNAFRRRDLEGCRLDVGALMQTTPKSPPLSPSDSEWKNRLSLCYEALERTKLENNEVKDAKRESGTLSGEENPVIKQEKCDQNVFWRVEAAGDKVFPMPPRRQVHFALTDIETCL
ncbi:hypothetical protein GJ744_001691 [Endocarpon pusillum]|uniref:Uncharacterized protein n=1 Tax=Endocarpon pusillum TaxID=364733 RepID=A0A8H7A901_9EURO|nr:hypothetical protein GJ744_001691 [Endocarpon pusillum]